MRLVDLVCCSGGTSQLYYRDTSGACLEAAVPPRVHTLGPAIPLDRFVRASDEIIALNGRIGAIGQVGNDGSRRLVDGYDPELGQVSPRADFALDHDRWLPNAVAFDYSRIGETLAFSNADCSIAVGSKLADSAICPIAIVETYVDAGECGYTFEHHRAGPPVAPDRLFIDVGGVCTPTSNSSTDRLVEIHELLAPERSTVPFATPFEVGAAVTPEQLYRLEGSTCVSTPVVTTDEYFVLGAKLAHDTFPIAARSQP
jgi:hypothetical protein